VASSKLVASHAAGKPLLDLDEAPATVSPRDAPSAILSRVRARKLVAKDVCDDSNVAKQRFRRLLARLVVRHPALSPLGLRPLSAEPDGMDGAPTASSVPRWSLSRTPSEGKPSMAKTFHASLKVLALCRWKCKRVQRPPTRLRPGAAVGGHTGITGRQPKSAPSCSGESDRNSRRRLYV
jgi:hypothetical protein